MTSVSVIRFREDLRCLECVVCGDLQALPKKVMKDQEAVLFMKETMAEVHGPCAKHPEDREARDREYAARRPVADAVPLEDLGAGKLDAHWKREMARAV